MEALNCKKGIRRQQSPWGFMSGICFVLFSAAKEKKNTCGVELLKKNQ